MNKRQKILTVVAMVIFGLTLCFVQWDYTVTSYVAGQRWTTAMTGVGPIWDPPTHREARARLSVLVVEWIALGVVYGGLMMVLRKKE